MVVCVDLVFCWWADQFNHGAEMPIWMDLEGATVSQQVYRITAETIARLQERKQLGRLAENVLEACANIKKSSGQSVLVRLDFPQDVGGVEIRCYRWSWLSWLFAGRAQKMWRDEE